MASKSSVFRPQIAAADVYRILENVIPDLTFQEAFEKTGRTINITVATVEGHQSSRLMNAISSPNVFVRSAILGSCALPGIGEPVILLAKNAHDEAQPYLPGSRWVDDAVTDDLPAKRLARLYGVNHYIVSQTNPISLALMKSDELRTGPAAMKDLWCQTGREWLRASEQFWCRYMSRVPEVSEALNVFHALYAQEYTDDINITPPFRLVDPFKVLGHLQPEEMAALYSNGLRSTWPQVEQIRLATQISRTLERILNKHRR